MGPLDPGGWGGPRRRMIRRVLGVVPAAGVDPAKLEVVGSKSERLTVCPGGILPQTWLNIDLIIAF